MKTIFKSVICLLWLLAPLSALAVPAEFSDVPTWYDYRLPYDGSGTFMEPYEISKPEHLAQLAYEVNEENNLHEGQFFILTADINLDKTVDGKRVQWIPIGYRSASYKKRYRFHGILLGVDTKKRMNETVWHEGLKHSISGMYINSKGSDEVEYYGLFGRMLGLVMGVLLKDFSIELFQQSSTGIMMVGGLCGALDDNSLDLSCIEYVGGPPFMSMGAGIDGCSVKGKIRAVSGNGGSIYIGGVVATLAENNGMIHTTSSVSIDADKCLIVGGVVAWGLSAIVDCAADAIISVGSMSAAGEGTGQHRRPSGTPGRAHSKAG